MTRRLTCGRCGAPFDCGVADGETACWCAARPYRLPLPPAGAAPPTADCLCPRCLDGLARQAGAPGSEDGDDRAR